MLSCPLAQRHLLDVSPLDGVSVQSGQLALGPYPRGAVNDGASSWVWWGIAYNAVGKHLNNKKMPKGFDVKCAYRDWESTSLRLPNSIPFHPKSFSFGVAQGGWRQKVNGSFRAWIFSTVASWLCISLCHTPLSVSLSFGGLALSPQFSHLSLPILRRSPLYPVITKHWIGTSGCCLIQNIISCQNESLHHLGDPIARLPLTNEEWYLE